MSVVIFFVLVCKLILKIKIKSWTRTPQLQDWWGNFLGFNLPKYFQHHAHQFQKGIKLFTLKRKLQKKVLKNRIFFH